MRNLNETDIVWSVYVSKTLCQCIFLSNSLVRYFVQDLKKNASTQDKLSSNHLMICFFFIEFRSAGEEQNKANSLLRMEKNQRTKTMFTWKDGESANFAIATKHCAYVV